MAGHPGVEGDAGPPHEGEVRDFGRAPGHDELC